MLSWNRPDEMQQAIASILRQQQVNFHLWIVDNGSQDDVLVRLRDIVRSESRISLTELAYNSGVAAGKNLAMSQGQGEIIVSLDNDAYFLSDHTLADIAALFDEQPRTAIMSCRIMLPDGRDDRLSWAFPRQRWVTRDKRFAATRFVGSAHAIRRAALNETQGYDEQIQFYWEELDLAYQMISLGWEVWYEPSIQVIHQVSNRARHFWASGRYYHMVRNILYVDYKYYRSGWRVAGMVLGYLVKGLYNGLLIEGLRGVWAGLRLLGKARQYDASRFDHAARAYIQQHDLAQRGGWWERIRAEVLERLPDDRQPAEKSHPPVG